MNIPSTHSQNARHELQHLGELLPTRARQNPDQTAFSFLVNGLETVAHATYAEIDARARAIAAFLQAEGVAGRRVLLLYVPGLEFVEAFYGCLYAGAVAVPAYPPDPARLARTLPRIQAVAKDAAPAMVLTTSQLLPMAKFLFTQAPDLAALRWVESDVLASAGHDGWVPPHVAPDDLAFIQYTSGSTASPRGVMISHRNVLSNLAMIQHVGRMDARTTIGLWVPFYHDLGLIAGVLLPSFLGSRSVLMSPIDFLRSPALWLRMIHAFKVRASAAPNFALDLCVRKIRKEDRVGLDLSSWEMALVGAEPLRESSLRDFADAFAPCGLRPEALVQGYGLAEAVLSVVSGTLDALYTVGYFDTVALRAGRVAASLPTAPRARAVVSCGRPLPGVRIRIVDSTGRQLRDEGQIGEIWMSGPNVAQGYWGQPEETARVFGGHLAESGEGPFLRTGDLGFVHGGELYVTGRAKELIILRGRNYYPHDIEQSVVRAHPWIRPGCVAAFALTDDGGERLGLVAEVDTRRGEVEPAEILAAIQSAVGLEHDVTVDAVGLLQPGTIPKTSSGKLQRVACRDGFGDRTLDLLHRWEAPRAAPPRLAQHAQAAPADGPTSSRAAYGFLLGAVRDALRLQDPEHRRVLALALVRAEIAATLGSADPAAISPEQPIQELGFDSITYLELSNRLSDALGTRLSPSIVYHHPEPERLAAALVDIASPAGRAAAPARSSGAPAAEAVKADAAPELRPVIQRLVAGALGRTHLESDRSLREMGIDDVLGAELSMAIRRHVGVRLLPRELVACRDVDDVIGRIEALREPYHPRVPAESLAELDAQIATPYDVAFDAGGPAISDKPIVFVLSPPRSGSTLLRVMLAGHSRLFSPQELHLAGFATMRSYDACLNGTVLNMGVVNTLGEVTSRAGAWNQYEAWVRDAVPTSEVYAFLGARIGARMLVDKSPLFFPPAAVLRRLSRAYPNARFVHLVRHPAASIDSYVKERFHAIFEATQAVDPYSVAEWCWTRVHRDILELEAELGADRLVRVFFEDLVARPEVTMRRLCPRLGVAFEPAVLEPYSGHRMVAGGFQIGDPNFASHRGIVAEKADAWRDVRLPRPLQRETMVLTAQLGYGGVPSSLKTPDGREPPMGGIDLDEDACLSGHVVPSSKTPARKAALDTILLTGASGFLGAFLLDELLRKTRAEVRCLVRAADASQGAQRIRENLRKYGLWRPEHEPRVVPVPGTLDLPSFGLTNQRYDALAGDVDAIYHCGGLISWLRPYRELRETNVAGLVRVLELACARGATPVHHVSTLGVAFVRPFANEEMVREVTAESGLGTESVLELPLGYLESKWVGTQLARAARRRGLPVTTYFPGLIAGHSSLEIDHVSDSQFIHALIAGSAQLGCFPEGTGWRFTPVDVVARNIMDVSLLPDAPGAEVYLDSATLLSPSDVVEELRAHGHPVDLQPFATWRQRVLDLARINDRTNALFPFTDMIFTLTPLRFRGQRHQLDWFLENRGVPEAVRAAIGRRDLVDRSAVRRLIAFYSRTEPLAAPRPKNSSAGTYLAASARAKS